MGLSGREQGKEPRSINTTWVTYQNEKSTRKRNSTRRAKRRVNTPLTGSRTLFRAKRPSIDSNNRPLPKESIYLSTKPTDHVL